jgi:glucokinase
MVREFLDQAGETPTDASFGVPGPVIGGRAHTTNLPWVLDEAALSQSLNLRRVSLLNDLQAIATAVPHLRPTDLHTINPGTRLLNGPIAVVAPGTGLGEAFLIWNGDRYIACSSEGGHASFAPANEAQVALWRHLANRFGHVSVERVCSGPGIANIYDCLRDAAPGEEPPDFAAALAQAPDRTPLITQAALQEPPSNKLAADALDLFVAILASEAGNMALKVLATGGVTLAGGIPAHVLPKLTDGRFLQDFADKGRFKELLSRVPIDVVTTRAALLGAALHGLDRMRLDPTHTG